IGNGSSATYGIQLSQQMNFAVFNNEIRNITGTGTSTVDGFVSTGTSGNSSFHNNKIYTIKNTGTTSTANITGIRANVTSGSNSISIYNNFVADLSSGYTGAATATRVIRGIYVQTGGGGTGAEMINVGFNNVSIDNSSAPNVSSACYETGSATGPVMNVENNVFSNSTTAQAAPAGHYAYATPSATATGNTGSVSNYNDLYIANATQGFTGIGSATTFATLANWQAAMTQDANSIAVNPAFNGPVDLHVNAVSLDGAGTSIPGVTNDIDNDTRAATPDIGADEFTASATDVGAILLVTPVAGNCYSAAEPVVVRIQNFGTAALDFTTDNTTVTVNVTGAVTQTLNITLTNNALNSGNPLASGATLDVPVGTLNMSSNGTYTFNANTTLATDANSINDAMPVVNITVNPGIVAVSTPSVCDGNSVTLTLSGNTNGTIQWQSSTDGGVTWVNETGPGNTSSPYMTAPSDTTMYRSLMCGLYVSDTVNVIWNAVTTPVTVNDTVCGMGQVTLSASGSGTLTWYDAATGGNIVNSGTSYTTGVMSTTTYYVSNTSGGSVQTVGPVDNTFSGGAQQLSGNYDIFDVYQSCVLQSVIVYPGSAGNVVIDLQDNTGTTIQQFTYAVTAGDVNNPTLIPVNFNLTPGTNYRLTQDVSSVSMFRNSAPGNLYPYTLPGVLSITNSAAGNTFFYFFYDWHILTGCESGRVPVSAVVIPSAVVTASATSSVICAGDSTQLTATSTNMNYAYTWTPGMTVTDSTAAMTYAHPQMPATYILMADSANCHMEDTIMISVNTVPPVSVSMSDSTICIGQQDSLIVNGISSAPFINPNPFAIPDASPAGVTSVISIPFSSTITTTSINRVCIDISHTWDGDLAISLISPLGTQIDLSSNNGGSGDNYSGTCFKMSAATNITAGAAPFTGNYLPEAAGGFNAFNGENTQGNWQLFVEDQAGGDVGTINQWMIQFNNTTVYSWSSNPPGFTGTGDTAIVSPAATTQYMLTVTDTTTGCTHQYFTTVNVNAPLSVMVSGDTMICPADSSFLVTSVTGGDGNYVYNWSDATTMANDTVVPASTTQYMVTVSDGCGTPVAGDSILVSVATPVMITSVTADTTVCSGTNVPVAVMISGGDDNIMYSWTGGGTMANDTVMSGMPGTSMNYAIDVMDGCGTSASDTVMISAFNVPSVTAPADTTVCGGSTVVLMSAAAGGDGNYSYTWSNGPVTANDTLTASSTMNYTVTVSDGCSNMGTDSAMVAVYSIPSVIVSSDTAICNGDSVMLMANATGGDMNYMYMWSNSDTLAGTTVMPSTSTSYNVTVTDGCGNSAMDSAMVTVNNGPVASFTQSSAGSTVTFSNTSTGATSYQWNFGDSQTSTSMSPSHTYAGNGTYTVTLIATNGCGSDTTTMVIVLDVGISEQAAALGIGAFPNPTHDMLNVVFNGQVSGNAVIDMYDLEGRLIDSRQVNAVQPGTLVQMDVTTFVRGVYMMHVTVNNSTVVLKVIVQ
ncbi:MAG TPA: PKD domain-containing protein, partial [Bacteroidia bacterium]|nr:PKD domain-containing protein [Bacteroidia bacterium]